jgi:5-hydroxyisourate hydrolase-like protein (transthyretin family)
MTTPTTATVSTHILDTTAGRPARGVAVRIAARDGGDAAWKELGGSVTDTDGRCKDLPAPPEGTTEVRLVFATGPYFGRTGNPEDSGTPDDTTAERTAEAQQDAPAHRDSGAVFFPEVTVTFAVTAGEHYHVPLLLNPFGYSVYRGS